LRGQRSPAHEVIYSRRYVQDILNIRSCWLTAVKIVPQPVNGDLEFTGKAGDIVFGPVVQHASVQSAI
jgi:hypothetical protein